MNPKGIIIHCSDSPQGRGDDINTIRQWHLARGFKDVGYHFVILEDGLIQTGRAENVLGSHAKGYNDYLGICLIGIDTFTSAQFASLKSLCKELIDKYNFKLDNVKGHCAVNPNKTCPNFNVANFKEEFL